MQEINDRVLTIAQIETALAIENIEEIAATEGVDALIVGPNDLSISLGVPGQLTSDIEVNAIRKVADACHKYGKAFGIHGPESLQEIFADDINLCIHTTDADMLRNAMKDVKARLQSFRSHE